MALLTGDRHAAAIMYCRTKGWLWPSEYLDALLPDRLAAILARPYDFLHEIEPYKPDNVE